MLDKIRNLLTRKPAIIPVAANQLYAIPDIDGLSAITIDATPEEINGYLDRRCQLLEKADARQLYACRVNGVEYVPVFRSEQAAKAFGDRLHKQMKAENPKTALLAFPILGADQRFLLQRVWESKLPAIVDPYTDEEQVIAGDDLRAVGANAPASPEIKKSLVIFKDKSAADAPKKPSAMPETLYALVGNENGLADLSAASAQEIRAHLEAQAEQSKTTDAAKLYACRIDGRTFIPVFSTADTAKEFVNVVHRGHMRSSRDITVVMTVVGLNQRALYERTVDRTGVAVVLDHSRLSERTITAEELESATAGVAAEISYQSLIWASPENSNVDRAL